MDTSKIDGGLWGRNDYPWDAYFSEPADESVLNWTPFGLEPDMQSPEVQNKINSMAGKMSIVIRITVSLSEFAEARRAKEAKHTEYERLAEENALKRKIAISILSNEV